MTSLIKKWLPKRSPVEPLKPGTYHHQAEADAPIPYRLHLRVEADGSGVMIVNAGTVLHLNPSATAHAFEMVRKLPAKQAARNIAARFRVSQARARNDYRALRDRILTMATNPDVDPVSFLGVDRADPLAAPPSAPYRLDLALTYACDPDGSQDQLARERVDRELGLDEWKEIITKAHAGGIPHITFTGGEPTRNPGLPQLVAYAESLGLVTGVLTEGRRLAAPSYVDELALAGLDHFLIAFVHDAPESLEGLKNALASDVFTAAHLTLAPGHAGAAEGWLEQLAGIGVPAISLSTTEIGEDAAIALAAAREQAADLGLDLIWDLPAPYSRNNPIALELEGEGLPRRGAQLYVEPDGDVLPSQGVDRILGNFLVDDWSAIWSTALSGEPDRA